MEKSYTKKYFQIYFWQALSIILNFASLFIVTPKLTAQPLIYGTYIVCISATIFLSYADLGFLSACYKYASECFASRDIEKETRLTAFGALVLFVFVFIIGLVFLFLSFHPQFLISDIKDSSEIKIASKLLIILSIFSLNNVLQRILQLIFGIRLEDYIFQRISIISSIIKIGSVFYFFKETSYNIVGYFLFSQLIGVFVSLIGIYLVKKNYNYSIRLFIKNFRFSKEMYKYTRGVAFGTLYVTAMWILYYELDSLVIAKFLGAKSVAYFAIGFSLLTAFRTIFGTLYSPFAARFNHFIGENDIQGLKSFYINVIKITLPIVLFPVLALVILMKSFVFSWVSPTYSMSVPIASFLIMSYIFSYISYPAGLLLIALEKIKKMYVVNTVIAVVYWLGIVLTVHYWGIVSFGVFKFLAFLIAGIFYIRYSIEFLEIKAMEFIKKIFIPIVIPISFILLLTLVKDHFPIEKNKTNLFIIIFSIAIITLIANVLYYFTCIVYRDYVNIIFLKIINRIKKITILT